MFLQIALLIALAVYVDYAISAELNFQLYAYGTGMKPGLQLFYGDGQLVPVPRQMQWTLTSVKDKRMSA
jgi:hypothetical protein